MVSKNGNDDGDDGGSKRIEEWQGDDPQAVQSDVKISFA
jgi:hypothetical protein